MSPRIGLFTMMSVCAMIGIMTMAQAYGAERTVQAPVAALDAKEDGVSATAIFAGGCFWGVEGVFSHVKGVTSATSGYAGGKAGLRVNYDMVSDGTTGYAESVRVTYDPRVVSYGTLLRIFFSVIADPTTLNYQGPDHGTQYRSALFPQSMEQDRVARAYLTQLGSARVWNGAIVTRVEPTVRWQPAEHYHQDFLANNPDHPYIRRWDLPKLAAFKTQFPKLFSANPSR